MHWTKRLEAFLPELIELRRHLHAHPEISGHEYQTSALIAGELRSYGWRVTESVGKTGVLAELENSNRNLNSPLVGLRVDMDALPIEEKTGLKFASLNQGVMHACGHDLHTCIGLGVAKLLAHENLLTNVRILFQPAEELAEGARWMKKDGAIEGMNAIFGVHVYPELLVGQIGIKEGIFTAAAGELEIEIIGESGHGARPHQAIDAIWIASRVVCGLQEAISRCLDPINPVVISFGKIEGGNAFNVIAERVRLLGTVRCLDAKLYETLPSWIEEKVNSIVSSLGGKAEVRYRSITPPIENNTELTDLIERCAAKQLGKENVFRIEKASLGAEDFAEYLQEVPGTMFRLGVSGNQLCAPLHNGQFDPQEDSLEIGIKVLTSALMTWMSEQEISTP